MSEMKPFSMRSFKKKVALNKRRFRRFLTRAENQTPRGFMKLTLATEPEVWKETDCLGCANCCKTMTPTFNEADIKRISAHFGETPDEFKKKWLYKDRVGDWVNKKQPCQFLNLKDNKCSIYAIRPADCSGFPHLRKPIKEYAHVHKQNVECCPATYRMVEKMMEKVDGLTFKAI
jgi:Fe-S-cluster containining protein